ncbi:hypothetical protein LEP1GSC047_0612 [Leptospira inadai serovar Lyme str. 10]|uniref:Uncharacterized protein n=1 Tax=Leptospira inadai serovar Lyme str. 10 TaxID=1049790 RepID=V6I0S3_9LEPT|nr:hypothetical protein LEP1GSC047_0612 [Leptospira inadai serovar Lyme str. 10]
MREFNNGSSAKCREDHSFRIAGDFLRDHSDLGVSEWRALRNINEYINIPTIRKREFFKRVFNSIFIFTHIWPKSAKNYYL